MYHVYDPHRLATVNGWCAHSECPISHPLCRGIGVPIYGTRFDVELCEPCDLERKRARALEREREQEASK